MKLAQLNSRQTHFSNNALRLGCESLSIEEDMKPELLSTSIVNAAVPGRTALTQKLFSLRSQETATWTTWTCQTLRLPREKRRMMIRSAGSETGRTKAAAMLIFNASWRYIKDAKLLLPSCSTPIKARPSPQARETKILKRDVSSYADGKAQFRKNMERFSRHVMVVLETD